MRPREQAFAPALDKIAVAVEHDHRVLAAIKDVDAVLAIDADRGDVGELPAVRQLRPVLHHAVTMLAGAEDVFHVCLPIVVIARSEATKQSIFPLVARWIASLRSQ